MQIKIEKAERYSPDNVVVDISKPDHRGQCLMIFTADRTVDSYAESRIAGVLAVRQVDVALNDMLMQQIATWRADPAHAWRFSTFADLNTIA